MSYAESGSTTIGIRGPAESRELLREDQQQVLLQNYGKQPSPPDSPKVTGTRIPPAHHSEGEKSMTLAARETRQAQDLQRHDRRRSGLETCFPRSSSTRCFSVSLRTGAAPVLLVLDPLGDESSDVRLQWLRSVIRSTASA